MKKKRMKKIWKFSFTIVFLLAIFFVVDKTLLNGKTTEKVKEKVPIKIEKKEVWPKIYEASIIATGDSLIHKSVYNDASLGDGNYDFSKQLKNIKPIIKNYDLAYYNNETIIGGKELGISTYPRFNTPDEFADEMINMGFNIVSLSTNHTMDKGEKGVLYSRNYWNNKPNVIAAGSYSSEEERTTPVIKEKNNIKYTMLSYTMLDNGLSTPKGKEFYNVMYSDDLAKADIERVRDETDVLIVSLHWGNEYSIVPTERQKEIAKYLSSLGVNIIYGTHSHVLQPIEMIGDTIVYYSLGNFISAQETIQKLTGVLSSLKITKTLNEDGTSDIKLSDFNNELIYTYYKKGNGWYDFQVIPYKDLNDILLPSYKTYYEKYKAVLQTMDNATPVVSLD